MAAGKMSPVTVVCGVKCLLAGWTCNRVQGTRTYWGLFVRWGGFLHYCCTFPFLYIYTFFFLCCISTLLLLFLSCINSYIGAISVWITFDVPLLHVNNISWKWWCQEKEVTITRPNGETAVTTVRVWNETVSNLTLMALGSSAPEILLSVIEVLPVVASSSETRSLHPLKPFLFKNISIYQNLNTTIRRNMHFFNFYFIYNKDIR